MTPDSAPADAAARAAELGPRVDAATQRLLQTAAGISDEQARAASLLPGWTRGHVLTHIARNADSLRNLLIWAHTGVKTPQYASAEARELGVAEGAGRPAAELIEDVEMSAAALAAEAAVLTDADWAAEVQGMGGHPHQGWYTLWRRLTEVEFHHVDLGAGYEPGQWPEEFAVQSLERVTAAFSRPDCPAAVLVSLDSGRSHRIGPAEAGSADTGSADTGSADTGPADTGPADTGPATQISGPTRTLLAWLTGRGSGAGLTVEPAGPLPSVPSW